MPEPTLTLRYFLGQVGEFWTLMGDRDFWHGPHSGYQQTAAKIALGSLYLRLKLEPQEQDRADVAWDAAIQEFTRRALYVG